MTWHPRDAKDTSGEDLCKALDLRTSSSISSDRGNMAL
jgi:hypothetical protein